jgi:hypothetical protein
MSKATRAKSGAFCERRAPVKLKTNDWLAKIGYNITSQGGEDGVIAQIFDIFEKNHVLQQQKWCVEFGAWDGKHLSNTYNLLYNQPSKWSGILIEADLERVNQMKQLYINHSSTVFCCQTFLSLQEEGPNTLTNVLKQFKQLPKDFDLISIDVDGADYHLWNELVEYHPKVVIIEFNPTIPNNVTYIQERSTKINHGSSLAALIQLGKTKGYELISTTTFNAFFVQKHLFSLFNIQDNHIDKMHDVPMQTEIFQLYDGTIKITGCKKLLWKQIPINEKDIQVLPESKRSFAFLPKDTNDNSTMKKNPIQIASDFFQQLQQQKEEKEQDPIKQKQNISFFLQLAKETFGKIPDDDVQRILQYPIQLTNANDTIKKKKQVLQDVLQVCQAFYQHCLTNENHLQAIKW